MFGKNKKKNLSAATDLDVDKKIHDDLVVHNMPATNRLSGPATAPQPKISGKNNFKAVGILIIGGGVIFIGLLFYFSYLYIIKPATKNNANTSLVSAPIVSPKTDNSSATTSASLIATTTEILATSSTVLDLNATSSGATSSSPIGEELSTTTPAAPLIDTDNDGLNDEEEAAFGTNPALTDTNNNSYGDLTEILNGYNPTGTGKLGANLSLATATSKVLGYSVLYPKAWTVKSLNNDNTMLFNAPDDSLIQISIQDNTSKQSILGWYSEAFPTEKVTYDQIKTTATWDGVMSSDGFNFYLTDKKHKSVYIISYIPAVDSRVAYPTVFKMMINTLSVK